MGFPEYKSDLLTEPFDIDYILDRYFHMGQSAVFYGTSPDTEARFKKDIVRRITGGLSVEVHPMELVICGSAHLGFSPKASKLGEPFHHSNSDIDLAIVSENIFDTWWHELKKCDLHLVEGSTVAIELLQGFINPNTVKGFSQMGKVWWDMFGEIETPRAASVRGRVYRSYWDMESYHRRTITSGRDKLLGKNT